MFGMSQDQLTGLIRQLLPVVGTLLGALGWVTPDKWAGITAFILQAVGPLLVLASLVWSVIANTKASILASAAKMPEVNKIEVANTDAGNTLADATARPEVVVK